MQCKDIDDLRILKFLKQHMGVWCTHWESKRIPSVMSAMPKGIPDKLYLAKMRQLLRRGLVTGCGCGCRGDWEITDKGLAFIGSVERVKEREIRNGY